MMENENLPASGSGQITVKSDVDAALERQYSLDGLVEACKGYGDFGLQDQAETLIEIIKSEDSSPADKISAIRVFRRIWRETLELNRRIVDLRRRDVREGAAGTERTVIDSHVQALLTEVQKEVFDGRATETEASAEGIQVRGLPPEEEKAEGTDPGGGGEADQVPE